MLVESIWLGSTKIKQGTILKFYPDRSMWSQSKITSITSNDNIAVKFICIYPDDKNNLGDLTVDWGAFLFYFTHDIIINKTSVAPSEFNKYVC